MRQLDVWLNQIRVGVLREGDDLWQFEYDEGWVSRLDGFDIAPGLPRAARLHIDGGTHRPVQWYFDNLLPEEKLRIAQFHEAGIKGGDDAFGLLEYLGAESAGSLTLLPPGKSPIEAQGRKPLTDEELRSRIRNMAREPLSKAAPKRMSLAGAQNKLPVIQTADGSLFEPIGSEPSTHILKPNHTSDDYAASVMNEYFIMTLARYVGMPVPSVHLHYVPEPVYVIERFDRRVAEGSATVRRHIVDACQLLNKSRAYKTSATMETLKEVIEACRNRAQTRLQLFRWLVFCALVGNDDNHLKNLSFYVGTDGISMAPHYDLLSTSVYATKALADERAIWQNVPMTIPHPGAKTFAEVSRDTLVEAGKVLGVPPAVGTRHIDELVLSVPKKAGELEAEIQQGRATRGHARAEDRNIEGRVIRAIRHVVINDMVERLK